MPSFLSCAASPHHITFSFFFFFESLPSQTLIKAPFDAAEELNRSVAVFLRRFLNFVVGDGLESITR